MVAEFGLVANRSQPELRRRSIRPFGFARWLGVGVRRIGADVRRANAVTPVDSGSGGRFRFSLADAGVFGGVGG